MVYLHFPSNLTEEEIMLQAKYAKLKKKKKALQALKAPKQEPEKPILPKRPTEARDAREIARKLLKSGAIQAIKSPPPQPQNATFKRPRAGRERKLSGSAGATGGVASYQPFSASQEPPPPEEKPSPRVKYLYDSFVTARDKMNSKPGIYDDQSLNEMDREDKSPNPHGGSNGNETPSSNGQRGCTLQICGAQIQEDVLRRRLASYEPFTVNLVAEEEKAYLTFQSSDIASRALTTLDGCEEGWRSSVARRPSPKGSWAPPSSPKPTQQSRDASRTLLTYDDIFE